MMMEQKKGFSSWKLKTRSNKVANFLKENGLVKDDRILLLLGNRIELFETFLGSMKLGCTTIPASLLLTAKDIEDRIIRGRIKYIIAEKVDAAGNLLEFLSARLLLGTKQEYGKFT